MDIQNANPLNGKAVPNRTPLTKSEIHDIIKESKSWLPRQEYEETLKAWEIEEEELAGQKVRDIMMEGRRPIPGIGREETRPIFDMILSMRGDMMETEHLKKVLRGKDKDTKLDTLLSYEQKRNADPLSILERLNKKIQSVMIHPTGNQYQKIRPLVNKVINSLTPKEKEYEDLIAHITSSPSKVLDDVKLVKLLAKEYKLDQHLLLAYDKLDILAERGELDDMLTKFKGLDRTFKNLLRNSPAEEIEMLGYELANFYHKLPKTIQDEHKLELTDDGTLQTYFDAQTQDFEPDEHDDEIKDEGDTYIVEDMWYEDYDIFLDLPYKLRKSKVYRCEYEWVINEETGEKERDEYEEGDDYYPEIRYSLVPK